MNFKNILFLLLSVIFFSGQCLSQWQPINGKQRFTTGLGVPSKDTGTTSSADTSMITIRPQDSALWVKYKGDWYKVPRVTTSNPFNILNGGNSFGATATIGTTDNNDLKIINNNTNYWTFGKTGTLSNSGVSFDFAGDVTASSSAAITGGAIYPINYLSLPDTNRNVAYNLIGTHNGSLFAQIGSGQYFRQVLMAKDSSLYITPTYFNANKGTGSITGNSPTITSSKVPLTYWNGTNHVGYTNGVTVDTACGNVAANTFYSGFSNVAASGTQITLTVLSTPNYYITGSGGQVVQLPDATTLPNGCTFSFNNNQSSGAVTVNNNSGTTVLSIPSGGYAYVVLVSNGSSAGTWDYHFSAPSAVSWSTNTFNLGAASITNATWNGSVIGSTKGGAGSVTGILKADGSGNVSAATAGASNDYLAGSSLSATRNVSTGSIFTYNSSTGAYNLDTTKIVANITTGFGLTGIGTSGSPLKVDSASVATVTQTFSPIITLTDGATITWDARNGCNAQVTLAGTGRTLTISNAVAGRTYHLDVYQDATGSRTITTYTNFISPAGVIPSLTTTASSRDEICIFYDGTKFTSVWLLNCK